MVRRRRSAEVGPYVGKEKNPAPLKRGGDCGLLRLRRCLASGRGTEFYFLLYMRS